MTHNMPLCAIPLPRCHGACYPDLAFVRRPVARAARPAPACRNPSRQRRRSASLVIGPGLMNTAGQAVNTGIMLEITKQDEPHNYDPLPS